MKFTEIKYTERKNNGNYEHSELSATAILTEIEDANAALIDLIVFVKEGLYGTPIETPEVKESIPTGILAKEAIIIQEEIKEKKTRAKKEKVEEPKSEVDSSNVPPVIVPEVVVEPKKEKKSAVVKYDSSIPEHKSIFGGYLAKKYDSKWKTVAVPEEIKKFTSSLNGQDFIDDKGTIVPTFLELIHTFFGA